jgi:hypothetical protein
MLVVGVLLFLGSALPAGAAEPARHAASLAESASSSPATGAKLTFRRIFKSSTPEFIEISVREDSDEATYEIRQLDDDPEKLPFEVSAPLRGKMFELAGQLNRLEGQDLDVHRKIVFNYTLNTAAAQLLQIFEGLARQQELLMLLERRMKYDRLGINDALLQFESDLNRKLLPEPQRALPALDQIASDTRFVDIARQRARAVAERIRHSNS